MRAGLTTSGIFWHDHAADDRRRVVPVRHNYAKPKFGFSAK
jgi:hypothetical protein